METAVGWMVISLKVHFRYYPSERKDVISDYAKADFSK